ncbi:hypothetical protein QN277_017610 [Acacia crassicarpa]|uniref:Uncharacterized protein n=1 Tax=Acacia crassicarpa TaxID=499986 RepID=A0AAE1JU04_9FABA|nr:hypothetical protein QN277_017610 [Acacia crassicarpa]
MVGGGSRRDEGSLMINNTNVFAALDALKKKKKSDKERKSKGSSTSQVQSKEPEPQVFWAPTPLNAKSWADVDDDDDYFATTAPPQSSWNVSEPEQSKEKPNYAEDSESEEDILDEGDDDVEEEHDHEPELSVNPEHEVKKPAEVSVAPKEAERQLSKKERKKKELAELEALLADFGVSQKESNGQDESRGAPQHKKDAEADGEKRENITAESKSAKKKKKKDKASKEVKESQDQPNFADTSNAGDDEVTAPANVEEDTSTVDVKERLKKVASTKKKKSSKEMDAAARAASQEAAARSARLAAAKKKEKNHYNQQPVR